MLLRDASRIVVNVFKEIIRSQRFWTSQNDVEDEGAINRTTTVSNSCMLQVIFFPQFYRRYSAKGLFSLNPINTVSKNKKRGMASKIPMTPPNFPPTIKAINVTIGV